MRRLGKEEIEKNKTLKPLASCLVSVSFYKYVGETVAKFRKTRCGQSTNAGNPLMIKEHDFQTFL